MIDITLVHRLCACGLMFLTSATKPAATASSARMKVGAQFPAPKPETQFIDKKAEKNQYIKLWHQDPPREVAGYATRQPEYNRTV